MDFVAIDIGASNTRYTSVDSRINFIPNNMHIIPNMADKVEVEKLDDVIENNLDISIWKEGESDYFPVRALIGSMADRYSTANVRPNQLRNKTDQQINYVSCIAAVALSKYKNGGLGSEVNIFLALPPTEVVYRKEVAKKNLIGNYTVAFNSVITNGNPLTMQFSVKNVMCMAESRLAIMQFLYDPAHQDRMAKYHGCTLLSLDIGASTTDLVIFKDKKFYDKSGDTFKIGGNAVIGKLKSKLEVMVGHSIPDDSIERYVVEGRIQEGAGFKEIGAEIDAAKEEVAREITNGLPKYFQSVEIPINDIAYIIVSGGGSMESSYITESGEPRVVSASISTKITDYVKQMCNGIEIIHFGDEPRLANIRGLGMVALLKHGEID